MSKISIEKNPDNILLLKIWWALTWRWLLWTLAGLVAWFIAVFILLLLTKAMSLDQAALAKILTSVGFLVGLYIGFWGFAKAFKKLLKIQIGHVKISLLYRKQEQEYYEPDVHPEY